MSELQEKKNCLMSLAELAMVIFDYSWPMWHKIFVIPDFWPGTLNCSRTHNHRQTSDVTKTSAAISWRYNLAVWSPSYDDLQYVSRGSVGLCPVWSMLTKLTNRPLTRILTILSLVLNDHIVAATVVTVSATTPSPCDAVGRSGQPVELDDQLLDRGWWSHLSNAEKSFFSLLLLLCRRKISKTLSEL